MNVQNTYHVYVEFYGKKIRVEVRASSKEEAEAKVRAKLNVLKVDPVRMGNPADPLGFNEVLDKFSDLMK